ncbi:MAG: DUF4430 domain-containing protein [Patescibacteria group bacterium]|nr:DUF4430 domain-containing protein [Patescibacteria group bacterium]
MSKTHVRRLVVWPALALALSPALISIASVPSSSVAYLQSGSQNSWTTMALVAAGVTHPSTDHLRSVSGSSVTDYAKAILALAAAGENPATFGNVNYVTQIQNQASDGQLGDANFLNDDAWGVLALSAAGISTSTPVIVDAVAFLQAHQNADGGFPFAVGGESDTNSTAATVLALREGGVASADAALTRAAAYLRAAQNTDGGFPYQPGGESDADSTAWIVLAVRKIGQDPAAWTTSSGSPTGFLESLSNPDGSYSWKLSVPGANAFATQDAVLALSGATMPVGYYRPEMPAGSGYLFRLEGRDATLCYQRLSGTTVYNLLEAGQTACGYSFSGQTYEGLGFLLTEVAGERAEGFSSWMYLVNNAPAEVGMQSYALTPGDEVLVYYDPDYRTPAYPDYDRPLRLTLGEAAAQSGGPVTATVTGWADGQWLPVAGAMVSGAGVESTTGADGTVSLTPPDGRYRIAAFKAGYIRSLAQELTVGSGVSDSVGLQAEVVNPTAGGGGGGTVGGSSIAFTIEPAAMDFGAISPGNQAAQSVTLHNGGTVALDVTAQVLGDPLFTSLKLDGGPWGNFQKSLAGAAHASTTVALPVPADYLGRGVKTGELIFWAEAR